MVLSQSFPGQIPGRFLGLLSFEYTESVNCRLLVCSFLMVYGSPYEMSKAGLSVGNPVLGHTILGHFSHFILGHFSRNMGHWGASLGSKLHNFYEVTLCQTNY